MRRMKAFYPLKGLFLSPSSYLTEEEFLILLFSLSEGRTEEKGGRE